MKLSIVYDLDHETPVVIRYVESLVERPTTRVMEASRRDGSEFVFNLDKILYFIVDEDDE